MAKSIKKNSKQIIYCRLLLITFCLTLFISVVELHGEKISIKTIDINGNIIDISQKKFKILMLLFVTPTKTNHKSTMVYAQVLYDIYRKQGLEIVGITLGNLNSIRKIAVKGSINYPLIYDGNNKIHQQFNIGKCCGGMILLDSNGRNIFEIQHLLGEDNTRQLIEKKILGKIKYSFKKVEQKTFTLNKKVPIFLKLTDPETGKEKKISSFSEDYLIITYFSSICSVCNSGRRIRTLIDIDNKIEGNYKILLAFIEPIDSNDIYLWGKNISMPYSKYISSDVFSREEKYITDFSKKTDPLTIVLNKNRKVIFIEWVGIKDKEFSKEISKIVRVKK